MSVAKIKRILNSVGFPTLYRAAAGGKTAFWEISVEPDGAEADIVTRYGWLDGAVPREQRVRVSEGGNVWDSPFARARRLAEAKYQRKLARDGYSRVRPPARSVAGAPRPMLAQAYGTHARHIDWSAAFAAPRLKGRRCLARAVNGQVELYDAARKPVCAPSIASALRPVFARHPEIVLDGDICACAPDRYYVYDLVAEQPFSVRFDTLRECLFGCGDVVRLVESVLVDDEDDLMLCQRDFLDQGYPGTMLRHGTAGYESNRRSRYLLAVEPWRAQNFKVVDAKEGRGACAGMAVFICETPAGHLFDVPAPGPADAKRAFWQIWRDFIGRKLTVRFHSCTSGAEPVPRFPAAIGFCRSKKDAHTLRCGGS